jgi:hypothetical protein
LYNHCDDHIYNKQVFGTMKLTEKQLRKMIKEGLWDFLKGKTEPRERWHDASGMSHAGMTGYQASSIEHSEYNLAVELVNKINSSTMWHGPSAEGIMADYDREGWLQILNESGAGLWAQALSSVGAADAQRADDVLEQWERSNYIVRSEPDVFSRGQRPRKGVWLRWYGFKELQRAHGRGKEYGL